MADAPGSDWISNLAQATIEVVKWVVAALATAVSTVGLWVFARYRGHVSMLTRHEELHKGIGHEFTQQRRFREDVRKGPHGEELAMRLDELRETDEKLHKRINRRRREHDRLVRLMVQVRRDIKWICGEMGRPEDGEEQ